MLNPCNIQTNPIATRRPPTIFSALFMPRSVVAQARRSAYLHLMTDYTINLEQAGARGRYVIAFPDGLEAEMTFSRDGDVMTIDHTGVPTEHEGQGVAAQLVNRALA